MYGDEFDIPYEDYVWMGKKPSKRRPELRERYEQEVWARNLQIRQRLQEQRELESKLKESTGNTGTNALAPSLVSNQQENAPIIDSITDKLPTVDSGSAVFDWENDKEND